MEIERQQIAEQWKKVKERMQVMVKDTENEGGCERNRGIERERWREGGIDLGLHPNKASVRSHSSLALPFPYQRTV